VRTGRKIKDELTSDPGPLAELLDPLRLESRKNRALELAISAARDLLALGKLALIISTFRIWVISV
jgi:hypothetical protein